MVGIKIKKGDLNLSTKHDTVLLKAENNLLKSLKIIKGKCSLVKGVGNFQSGNDFYEISYKVKLLKNPPLDVAYDRLEHGETVLDTGYFKRKLIIDDLIRYKEKHPFLKLVKRRMTDC